MRKTVRDVVAAMPTLEYFTQRMAEGWTLSVVEWSRQEESSGPPDEELQDPPYGMRVAADCGHLVEDEYESEILLYMYEQVVSGRRPLDVSASMNAQGYRTRRGTAWTAGAVFELLPRLIELSPRLQRRSDWPIRRARLEILA